MGFRDAINEYNSRGKAAPSAAAPTVPVNPPEAVKVLVEQTEPETEGKPEPAPLEVTKPKARAPRGSKAKSAEPAESSDTEASSATEAPRGENGSGVVVGRAVIGLNVCDADLVRELFIRGYGVTKL